MLKKKRVISLVLSIGMLLGVLFPIGASAQIDFSDVPSNHNYYEAITNLVAEGIINGFEDGTYKPEDPVTRAQYTKIICYATGVGDVTYSEGSRAKFPDVDPNHWAIDNITTAKNSGIINGYDDGTFKPDQAVLYEQAVKMSACAIGYPEERAKDEGGYPMAFLRFAKRNGLLDGVDGVEGEPLTRGKVAQLIDNMRNAKQVDSETGEPTGSIRDEDKTSSSVEGKVISANKVNLYWNDTTQYRNREFAIELADGTKKSFWVDNIEIEDAYDYIGRSVTVYHDVNKGADLNQATRIAFAPNKNAELTVDFDDVASFSATALEYYDANDNEETISVDADAEVIHNGQAVNKTFKEIMNEIMTEKEGSEGDITLVCSNTTGIADTVFVKTYITFVAGSPIKDSYRVPVLNEAATAAPEFDEEDRSKTIKFTKDGKPSTFAEIASGNIISYAESDNGNIIDVQISSKSLAGAKVVEIKNGKVKFDKSEEFYDYSNFCYNAGTLEVNNYGTFYLDVFGKIARIVLTSSKTLSYGYLSDLSKDSDRVVVYKASASSTTLKKENSIYKLASKVDIDGETYDVKKEASKIEEHLRNSAKANINNTILTSKETIVPSNAEYAQPIRFSTSSADVIDSIVTHETGESGTSGSLILKDHTKNAIECTTNGTVIGNYSVSSSTPIIIVPANRTLSEYKTSNNSCFQQKESYYVHIANPSTMGTPAAIYLYATSKGTSVTAQTITKDHAPYIVKAISDKVDDGESRKNFTFIGLDGTDVTVMANPETYEYTVDPTTLAVGDVVRFATDGTYISDIKLVVAKADVDANKDPVHESEGASGDEHDIKAPYHTMVGLARVIEDNKFRLAPTFVGNDATTEEVFENDSTKVYIVDTSNAGNPVTVGEFSNIIGYRNNQANATKVLTYSSNGKLKMVVIFR